jgi:hypothetical protein
MASLREREAGDQAGLELMTAFEIVRQRDDRKEFL